MKGSRYKVVTIDGENKLEDTWNNKIVEGVLLSKSISEVRIADDVEFNEGCLVMISTSNMSISGGTTFYKESGVKIRENVHLHRVLFMKGMFDFLANEQVVIEGAIFTGNIKIIGSTTYIKNCRLHCKSTFITGVNILEDVTATLDFDSRGSMRNHNSIENVIIVRSDLDCNEYTRIERSDITHCEIDVRRNLIISDSLRIGRDYDGDGGVEMHNKVIINDKEYEGPEEHIPF